MGFKTGDLPAVELDTFLAKPLLERTKTLALHWVDYGFGSPKMLHAIYIIKLLFLYIGVGLAVITLTSGLGPVWEVASWWNQPIVYQKLVIWTLLLETIGVAGSWGPLAGKFKPMTGGLLFWVRPGTIRLPPWPGKVPFTRGDSRSLGDVFLYLALLGSLVAPLLAPGTIHPSLLAALPENTTGLVPAGLMVPPLLLLALIGLRDKTIFIAARAEQYGPILLAFAIMPLLGNGFVDLVIVLKLIIVSVWVGAGVSKFGKHFGHVIPPMVSNTPWIPTRFLRRLNYRNYPTDIRPSKVGGLIAHGAGTFVEIAAPIILLFSTNTVLTLSMVFLIVGFHLFITSTFPLAVPLEWNLLFAYTAVFLFAAFPANGGYSLADASSPWLVLAAVFALFFFPVLGNLRPDLVAFTPSMRQYAGNWAAALWAFQPGAEEKLNRVKRPTANQFDQLLALGYSPEHAEITLQQTIAWRSMHSQGRGLFSLLINHVNDVDNASVREAEFICNSLTGFNFGDGHLHDEALIRAVQRRCHFAPGELVVAWVESQPIHKNHQSYKVIDAALGVIETGTWQVADAVAEQPWLPNGPIATTVTWRRPAGTTDAHPAAPNTADHSDVEVPS